ARPATAPAAGPARSSGEAGGGSSAFRFFVPLLIPCPRTGGPPPRGFRYAFVAGTQPDHSVDRYKAQRKQGRAREALWEDGFPWPTTRATRSSAAGGAPG